LQTPPDANAETEALLNCPTYDEQRAKLTKKVGIGGTWIEKLLGYPELIKHTLKYVEETKRMPF